MAHGTNPETQGPTSCSLISNWLGSGWLLTGRLVKARRGRQEEVNMKAKMKAVAAPSYEPKPREQAAIEAWRDRRHARAPSPWLKVEQKRGRAAVGFDHSDPAIGSVLLMQAIGTSSIEFLQPFISQLVNAGSKGAGVDAEASNFMLAVVKAIEPKDELEAMLAAQMAAVHMATMTFARRLNHVESIPQQDSAERTFNRLARTFTTQMEALKHYRTGGQQRVTVEHVTVNAGGQAIVGAVEAGGGVANGNQRQPHAKQIAHAPVTPLRSQDETREPVPVAGDAER
jgi:hypothetical protein